jgi:hypothetical protein
MNYLTNYYKNLCEQLQEKINILETQLRESYLTEADLGSESGRRAYVAWQEKAERERMDRLRGVPNRRSKLFPIDNIPSWVKEWETPKEDKQTAPMPDKKPTIPLKPIPLKPNPDRIPGKRLPRIFDPRIIFDSIPAGRIPHKGDAGPTPFRKTGPNEIPHKGDAGPTPFRKTGPNEIPHSDILKFGRKNIGDAGAVGDRPVHRLYSDEDIIDLVKAQRKAAADRGEQSGIPQPTAPLPQPGKTKPRETPPKEKPEPEKKPPMYYR